MEIWANLDLLGRQLTVHLLPHRRSISDFEVDFEYQPALMLFDVESSLRVVFSAGLSLIDGDS